MKTRKDFDNDADFIAYLNSNKLSFSPFKLVFKLMLAGLGLYLVLGLFFIPYALITLIIYYELFVVACNMWLMVPVTIVCFLIDAYLRKTYSISKNAKILLQWLVALAYMSGPYLLLRYFIKFQE